MIDVNVKFEHLPSAPIVEAVIHWQAPAGKTLDRLVLRDDLNQRFSDFECHEQHEVRASVQSSSSETGFRQQMRWDGYRLNGKGDADRYVVQFRPNGVVFSRLEPYEQWDAFQAAALQFWGAYVELAEPPVIERLGVRFINQIALTQQSPASY
jgi:uncharacterized protein (TIGR04255 family)